jgi:hypothetical protein
MIAIVDLEEPNSPEEIRHFCYELLSAFGITEVPPAKLQSSFPSPLSPEELRELNTIAGQKLGLLQE